MSIEGGVPLNGSVRVSGAKNAALPLMAGAILLKGETTLTNVPYLKDIVTMLKMLNSLGVRAEYHHENTIKICNERKIRHIAPYDLVTAMRASFFVAGPILARTGMAKVPLPGGCSIGTRPIDIHLKGFEDLGAKIDIEHGFVVIRAPELIGSRVRLRFPSVGATENILMAATLAKGTTVIENAAQEPEVTDLANFLNAAGAKITGMDTPTLTIQGVESLEGVNYPVIPDRIEGGTLLIAGAITGGEVTATNINIVHQLPLIEKLKECGFSVEMGENTITVSSSGYWQGCNIDTEPFPGFPTDMQAQMMALLSLADGQSIIKESIFENRYMHAPELMRMGADIKLDKEYAIISGVKQLGGAEVKITDLRAGAALFLAGLAAEGKTTVYGLKHLKRGYERLHEKLQSLGAKINS
jgi:UDP-N-acetylglucosamine 1-carboxyvinyltransferase